MPSISDCMTNTEILQEIGVRFKNKRLGRNMPIEPLADRAGVNRKTILSFEAGEDIRLSSVIKILRGLGELSLLTTAFPDVLPGGEGLSVRGQPRLKAAARRNYGRK